MAARNTYPCWTQVPPDPGNLQLDMFAGPSVHPRLPRFMLSHPGAFVVNRNIVGVANILPGEAMNMQEFGAVSVYNHYAFTLSWKELINLSYHANKLGRWGTTPQGYPVSGGRSEQAGRGGTARPGSATPLLSFQISQANRSALLHPSTLLLPSCLFRCN